VSDTWTKSIKQPIQLKREAEKLTARLEQRERELKTTRNVVSNAPVVLGGALVIPQGLLDQLKGDELPDFKLGDKQRIERIAMEAVLVTEQALGNQTKDVSAEKCGWDITSTPPGEDGKLSVSRHIEVKGRVQGATTVTVTKNEILYALNQQEQFLLAIVLVNEDDSYEGPYYLRNPFTQEPDWAETSKNLELRKLLERAELAV
jgi:hypothetical protein